MAKSKSSNAWITKRKKTGHLRQKKNKYSEHNYTCYGTASEEQLHQNKINNMRQHKITLEKKLRRNGLLSKKDEQKLVHLQETLA